MSEPKAADATMVIPRTDEHCSDDAAWAEFCRQYDGTSRSFGSMSDFTLANAVFMVGRNDLDLIRYQTAAKERIRWLSIELAKANAALADRTTTSFFHEAIEQVKRWVVKATTQDARFVRGSIAEASNWLDDAVTAHDRRVAGLLQANNREVENRRQITAALRECEDKLWVLRCNSRDPLDRQAAEAAIEQAKTARETIKR